MWLLVAGIILLVVTDMLPLPLKSILILSLTTIASIVIFPRPLKRISKLSVLKPSFVKILNAAGLRDGY